MFQGYEGKLKATGKELAQVTILLSYLFTSLAISGALLWVLVHRGSGVHYKDSQQHWDPM
jgi:hypothetical protein